MSESSDDETKSTASAQYTSEQKSVLRSIKSKFKRFEKDLNAQDDWKLRLRTLEELQEFVEESMNVVPERFPEKVSRPFLTLSDDLARQVTDLRSELVKQSVETISVCASLLKNAGFLRCANNIISALLDAASTANIVIRKHAAPCLQTVVLNCQSRTILNVIIVEFTGTRSKKLHNVCMSEILNIVSNWDLTKSSYRSKLPEIESVILKGLKCPGPKTRALAAKAVHAYTVSMPDRAEAFTGLDARTKRIIERSKKKSEEGENKEGETSGAGRSPSASPSASPTGRRRRIRRRGESKTPQSNHRALRDNLTTTHTTNTNNNDDDDTDRDTSRSPGVRKRRMNDSRGNSSARTPRGGGRNSTRSGKRINRVGRRESGRSAGRRRLQGVAGDSEDSEEDSSSETDPWDYDDSIVPVTAEQLRRSERNFLNRITMLCKQMEQDLAKAEDAPPTEQHMRSMLAIMELHVNDSKDMMLQLKGYEKLLDIEEEGKEKGEPNGQSTSRVDPSTSSKSDNSSGQSGVDELEDSKSHPQAHILATDDQHHAHSSEDDV